MKNSILSLWAKSWRVCSMIAAPFRSAAMKVVEKYRFFIVPDAGCGLRRFFSVLAVAFGCVFSPIALAGAGDALSLSDAPAKQCSRPSMGEGVLSLVPLEQEQTKVAFGEAELQDAQYNPFAPILIYKCCSYNFPGRGCTYNAPAGIYYGSPCGCPYLGNGYTCP